jgi:hypothetical protein
MEYSVEVYQSKVKTVITNHDIYIEVVEEITNNRLQWSYLNSGSLYLVQTIYSLICEFPSKFAAAIQLRRLKKKKERGFHVLFATSTMLEGLIANENISCCINLHDIRRCSIKKPSHDFRSLQNQ